MQCCSSARLAEVKALKWVLDFVGGQTEEWVLNAKKWLTKSIMLMIFRIGIHLMHETAVFAFWLVSSLPFLILIVVLVFLVILMLVVLFFLANGLLLDHPENILPQQAPAPQLFGECCFVLFNASFIVKNKKKCSTYFDRKNSYHVTYSKEKHWPKLDWEKD